MRAHVIKESHQDSGNQFDNRRESFPDGERLRITIKPTVENCAIHKQANIQRQQKTQFLLSHRFK
jgi:hypothetical protein